MSARNCLSVLLVAFVSVLSACAADDPAEGSTEQLVAPVPQNLAGTVVSATQISLTWDPVAGATKYVLLRGAAPGTEISYTSLPGTSTTYSNGHILPGETTCWQLKSVVNGEISAPSNEVCLTTGGAPGAPTNVAANAVSSSRIVVTWDAVAGATKYYVFQALQAAGPYTQIGTVSAVASPSFTAVGLQPATTYFYTVQTQFAGGQSAQSDPPASATTFVLGLEGYWKFDEDGVGATAFDSSGFNRNGTLTGAAAYSNTKAPIIDNPSAILIPGGAGDSVSVANVSAWNLAGDFTVALWANLSSAPAGTVRLIGKRRVGCGAVASWELFQDGTGLHFSGAAGSTVNFNASLTPGTYTHVAVAKTAGTAHLYINGIETASAPYTVGQNITDGLQIGNSGGCGSATSFLLDDVMILSRALSASEVAAIGRIPDAPTNLTGTVVSPTRISLSWDPVPNAAKYLIFKGTAAGNEVFLTSHSAATATFDFGHLSPSETSSWQVGVVVGTLISNRSNEVVLTTDPPPPAPTGLTATAVSSTRINLSWNAVAGAGKYFVFQSQNGGAPAFKGTSLTTTFAATGLTANTLYTYTVRAVSAADNITQSADSAPASATTLP